MDLLEKVVLFSGSSHPTLAKEIATLLQKSLGDILLGRFPDGENQVEIRQNVRGKDLFILQSLALDVDHYLMELLLIIDAAKRASSNSITALIPYFGYARQDKKTKGREPISARLVADLLETAGASHIVTFDLHAPQIQGFFSIPVDNLAVRPLFVEKIKKELDVKKLVIVSPDVGRTDLARAFAKDLQVPLAIIDKTRIDAKHVIEEALIGEVRQKDVLLVDDIWSTGATLRAAAKLCREGGAKKIYIAVSHGPLILDELKDDAIAKIFTTNTIAHGGSYSVSVAPLLAEAIKHMAAGLSLLPLYQGKF